MYRLKRFFCLILTLTILTGIILPSRAQEEALTNKAYALNQLSLLAGDGTGYNLEGRIRRFEAAVFIVRILGKVEHVAANTVNYVDTGFPDVQSTSWYAPYIGYCVKNSYLSGFNDGTFKAELAISEKSFLSIMLRVLGYEPVLDFTWDDVYENSYEAGLVTDAGYLGRTADNTEYTRGDVVNVLYNALTKENKKTGVRVIDALISEGAANRDIAAALGLVGEAGEEEEEENNEEAYELEIEKITAVSQKRLKIEFSEEVGDVDESNITVYETDDITEKLTVEIDYLDGEVLFLHTSAQEEGVEYTIEISELEDADGNTAKAAAGTFKGYKAASAVESDFFRLKSVEAVNRKTVNAYFTQPLNINSEIASYYSILEGGDNFAEGSGSITVKLLGTNASGVSITLKDKSFREDETYTLEVSGKLTSLYGAELNEGKYEEMDFTGAGNSVEAFKLEDITVRDSKTVMLIFNKEVNPSLAQQKYTYYITDSAGDPCEISSAAVKADGNGKGVTVYISLVKSLKKNEDYTLRLNIMNDITKQEMITEEDYEFTGRYTKEDYLEIDDVNVLNSGTIEVVFSEPVNAADALRLSNYYITGESRYTATPVSAYYDAVNRPDTVKLFLPSDKQLVRRNEYEIRLSSTFRSYLGHTLDEREFEFTGTSNSNVKPGIEEALIIGNNLIKVTFDVEIAAEIPNLLPSNYILTYEEDGVEFKKAPVGLTYINPTTLIVRFDSLDYDTEYVLSFNELKDYSGQYTATSKDDSSIDVEMGER